MSSDKNPEVVGCDASIMRNVWEIREREYEQKMQMEQERLEKSALPAINKEWAGRLSARQGNYKRPESKRKALENKVDDNDVWKTKKPQAPPPRGVGSAPPSRPGVQSRGPSTTTTTTSMYKEKKVQDKNLRKLQLIMYINQNQPSTMVWGKSWKYNKSLPPPAEGAEAISDWGHCWMFATQQPYSEAGQPWKNGPNLTDPSSLHFWEKSESRVVETEELDLSHPDDEWQMSWKKFDKNNMSKDSVNGEYAGLFKSLVETHQKNKEMCSSDWSDAWRSTKPSSEQDHFTALDHDLMNLDDDMSSNMEGWRLTNHLGGNNVNMTQVKKSLSPVWACSWRAAMEVSNNDKNSEASLKQGHSDSYGDNTQQRKSIIHKVMLVTHEQKYRDQYQQLHDEFKALSEWSKSWQVTKNNSKPCEEIEKVLKMAQETASKAQKVDNNALGHHSASDNADPRYEQLKYDVIYRPRREFTQSQMLRMKNLENVAPTPEWKDSWQMIKNRMRMERRRMRPDPARPFRGPERGGDMKPASSEWKNSWKFTSQPMRQEPEAWQQGWATLPQIRVDRALEMNHFAPVEYPKNGPTTERNWGQSWRFSRRQHQSEHSQARAQTSQASSSAAFHHPNNSWAQRQNVRPGSDWQEAWMVSETQFRHDRPSLTQWREAWQWSIFHTERWTEHVPVDNRLNRLLEIQPQREWVSLHRAQAKMSRSFDNKMFRERYPEKQWSSSWSAGPFLSHMPSFYGASAMPGKSMGGTFHQQHGTTNGHGSMWGSSFRIANPMPKVDQPWVKSSGNPSHYTVMWSKGKIVQNKMNPKICNSQLTSSVWGKSFKFLQGPSGQSKDKTKSRETLDPMVIIAKRIDTRKDLYSGIDKEKGDKKWAGCHLLGKTQPRPKRGASVKVPNMDEDGNEKFFEEWVESWRYLVKPGSLRKNNRGMPFKAWEESWKFLIPPYPPTNGHKTR